ncbi:MAG: T9SS type A sorting domain-containing protein [Bacteroidales bacterium]|nr:T9SS type A sorting domain-containing protein [Bacteroidales bacterium]
MCNKKKVTQSNTEEINTPCKTPGIYVLSISSQNSSSNLKIIKK